MSRMGLSPVGPIQQAKPSPGQSESGVLGTVYPNLLGLFLEGGSWCEDTLKPWTWGSHGNQKPGRYDL